MMSTETYCTIISIIISVISGGITFFFSRRDYKRDRETNYYLGVIDDIKKYIDDISNLRYNENNADNRRNVYHYKKLFVNLHDYISKAKLGDTSLINAYRNAVSNAMTLEETFTSMPKYIPNEKLLNEALDNYRIALLDVEKKFLRLNCIREKILSYN